MNNTRQAFTMIELVFTIVIIGILVAVAIPKLTSISVEARKAEIESFIGTLNRTAAPLMHMHAVSEGDLPLWKPGGKCDNIDDYIELPDDVTISACYLTISNPTPTRQPVYVIETSTRPPFWAQPRW